MKPTTSLLFILATTALSTSIMTRQSPPDEQYNGPLGWQFKLLSWSGDGCPDFQANSTPGYLPTRDTTGTLWNTSSSTYWWYVAFPWMQAELKANDTSRMARVSCDLTMQYDETGDYGKNLEMEERTHRLKLHKNGSLVMANYRLDEGVNAEWHVRFTNLMDFTVQAQDWGSVEGPLDTGTETENMALHYLEPLFTDAPLVQPQCGTATFRIRFDLYIAGRKAGVGGKVDSGKIDWNNGKGPQWDGTRLGFSYDWEKC